MIRLPIIDTHGDEAAIVPGEIASIFPRQGGGSVVTLKNGRIFSTILTLDELDAHLNGPTIVTTEKP